MYFLRFYAQKRLDDWKDDILKRRQLYKRHAVLPSNLLPNKTRFCSIGYKDALC